MASVVEGKDEIITMRSEKIYILLLGLLLQIPICAANKSYNPLMFGWQKAKTDIERYWVLYNTHTAAMKENVPVDYSGLRELNIEIPTDAKTIPLTDETDFKNATLRVTNNSKNICLFEKISSAKPINATSADVDNGFFKSETILRNGLFILSLSDKNPWVKNRKGYSYGHTRRDLLLIDRGYSKNSPISSYDNDQTKIDAKYCTVSKNKKIIKNLHFYRKEHNTKQIYFLRLSYQYNVELKNIDLHTPQDTLTDDALIGINDSYKLVFEDILIDGTYSKKNHSGYGICMNIVSDVRFRRLIGHANWGIFGNNNVKDVKLVDCDINRFDIHCYGKNVAFVNCKFRDLYNQFSSISGKVSFKDCEFFDFIPVLFESSYNAYRKFDLSFKNCVIHASNNRNYLISGGRLNGEKTDERLELSVQDYPNIYIDGLTVDMSTDTENYYIYRFNRGLLQWPKNSIPGLRSIKRIRFVPDSGKQLELSNLQSMVKYPDSKWVNPILYGSTLALVCGSWFCYKRRKA